jgi:phenylalanyl-tRNA synthetase alpha chain
VRFRPSFFPFTEPSAEVDVACSRQDGKLIIGKGGDWLELLGCGMVHENVLKACDIDTNGLQGFAFGMGLERLTMLKYGMTDIRHLYEGDIRFHTHFGSPYFSL